MAVYEMKKKLNPLMEMGSYGIESMLCNVERSKRVIRKLTEPLRTVSSNSVIAIKSFFLNPLKG